jgi:hypothetical protein
MVGCSAVVINTKVLDGLNRSLFCSSSTSSLRYIISDVYACSLCCSASSMLSLLVPIPKKNPSAYIFQIHCCTQLDQQYSHLFHLCTASSTFHSNKRLIKSINITSVVMFCWMVRQIFDICALVWQHTKYTSRSLHDKQFARLVKLRTLKTTQPDHELLDRFFNRWCRRCRDQDAHSTI